MRKMRNKRLVILMLGAILMTMTVLTGCSDDLNDPVGSESIGKTYHTGKGKKIALVTSKANDNPFIEQMIAAGEDAAYKYDFQFSSSECELDTDEYEVAIRHYAEEGYDLIIGGGWETEEGLNKTAGEFPNSKYALVDSTVDNDRVKCISYREQESAYLVGMLAAMTVDGKSHLYGAINVEQGPGSWKYRYGYMQGVLAVDPEATFVFRYVGNYYAPEAAEAYAHEEAAMGAAFINAATAGGDKGIFKAAKEDKFYTSGQDVDVTDVKNPYIISSQIKNTYMTVTQVIESFLTNWSDADETWGIAENVVGAVHVTDESMNPRTDRLTDAEVARVKEAADRIASGTIDLRSIPDEETFMREHPGLVR